MRNTAIIKPPTDGMWKGVQLDLAKLGRILTKRPWVYLYELEDLHAEAVEKQKAQQKAQQEAAAAPPSHLFWWM